MQLHHYPDIHLSYCSNIHPGEEWDEVFAQLQRHLPVLKQRLSTDRPFGIGLRLSARAAENLSQEKHLERFQSWLKQENMYVFTMNGFPYGSFHGERVKDRVYAPDWQTGDRVAYSKNLADLLADLLEEGQEGSISTSPVSYKPWLKNDAEREQAFRVASRNLAEVALHMANIRKSSGKFLHLDIEPEPDCLIENTDETIRFFKEWILRGGKNYLIRNQKLTSAEAENLLREHIQVCYDTCHFAVEYENPENTLARFLSEGIGIGKMQISAALKVPLPDENRQEIADRLQAFAEDTYLHQVIERHADGRLHHYADLPKALEQIHQTPAKEWRIHYHVPVFSEQFETLQSTQDDIIRSIDYLKNRPFCRHLEVETYTWEVLPDSLKNDVTDSIERELNWVNSKFK